MAGNNIGARVSNFIGFDPTPGFNLSKQANGQAGTYGVTATGTTNLFGRQQGQSSNDYVNGLTQRVNNSGQVPQYRNDASTTQQQSGAYTDGGAAQRQADLRQQYGDPSQYDAEIGQYQNQIGGLGAQQQVGEQNVNDQYNKAAQGYYDNKARDETSYNRDVQQNVRSYTNNRTKTMNSVRSNANALQRLLGMNGAGNSSAALEQAPYAAGLQGSQDLAGAQETYGMNGQRLSDEWTDRQKKYKDGFDDLENQKWQAMNGEKSKTAQARAGLLDKIANASVKRNLANGQTGAQAQAGRNQYQPEIESLLQQITQLGRTNANPVLQAQAVAPRDFTLSDYAQGRRTAIDSPELAGGGEINPVFASLFNNRRDEYNTPRFN